MHFHSYTCSDTHAHHCSPHYATRSCLAASFSRYSLQLDTRWGLRTLTLTARLWLLWRLLLFFTCTFLRSLSVRSAFLALFSLQQVSAGAREQCLLLRANGLRSSASSPCAILGLQHPRQSLLRFCCAAIASPVPAGYRWNLAIAIRGRAKAYCLLCAHPCPPKLHSRDTTISFTLVSFRCLHAHSLWNEITAP